MLHTLKESLFRGSKARPSPPQLSKPSADTVTSTSPSSTEEPDLYRPGGFHRVSLGDTLQGKYSILRKLGYGEYSTVWLARESKTQKYVALKILRADCYGGTHEIFEREILSKITRVSQKSHHPGGHYVSSVLDQFKHQGPNGVHVCLVFDVLGHHLGFQCAEYEDKRLPVRAVKVIARQLLLGLDFLHRECGIIHTDLTPANILLELENPDETITQYLSKVPPRTERQASGMVVPLREVIDTPLVSEMKEPRIRIIDFGVSSWTDAHLSDMIQSPALRAPEVTIGASWDTSVDIWSLGCLIVEFLQGIVLFSGRASKTGTWTADDDRLAKTMEVLGPFPPDLLKKGHRSASFFDENGNLLRIPHLKPTSLESLIDGTTKPCTRPRDMPADEVPILVDFLRGMLAIDPARRKSAAELAQHEWLRM